MAKKITDTPASKEELMKKVRELEKEVVTKKLEMKVGKLKDVRAVAKLRDEIARMLTMIRAKELEEV